jgi:hypothetical protein
MKDSTKQRTDDSMPMCDMVFMPGTIPGDMDPAPRPTKPKPTTTRLKVVEQTQDQVAAPEPPSFDPAPTRKQHAGWTAERQRKFIEHLSLTGSVGGAAAVAGVSSRSAYRLRNRAGAESFARAWDAALSLSATRLAAIAFDRAINGRAERFYRDGELVMERRMPSDYLLTWLLARLDPLQFGSPAAKSLAASGDPRDAARNTLPQLTAALTDVAPEDCACAPADYIDNRLGEMAQENDVRSYVE